MSASVSEYLVELSELAAAPRPRAQVGGKALFLARLLAAGLPVPPGWVVTSAARDLEEAGRRALLDELRARTQALGATLVVRSSATLEDDVAASAPGVFASLVNVSAYELEAALTRVWASSETALVREYARLRGTSDLSIAVIVQRQVPEAPGSDTWAGTLYTRRPGHPEGPEMLVEIRAWGDGALDQEPRTLRLSRADQSQADAPGAKAPEPAVLDDQLLQTLRHSALAAERAIDARAGADVEWVVHGDSHWIVQARPLAHPPKVSEERPQADFPPVLMAFSRLEPALVWRWDLAHNPDPLSPAQAGLVELLDQADAAPYRMRVVGSYLYYATPADVGPATTGTSPAPSAMDDAQTLRSHFDQVLVPGMLDALAPARVEGAGLTETLAAYQAFYELYAHTVTPLLDRAKGALSRFLRERGLPPAEVDASAFALARPEGPIGVGAIARAAAAGRMSRAELVAEIGDMAPAWDVACPTLAETPALLDRAIERAAPVLDAPEASSASAAEADELAHAVRAALPAEDHDTLAALIALSRTALELAERDDIYFAHAQAAMRRTLLTTAQAWGLIPADDIFYLPFSTVLAWNEHQHPPDTVALGRLARAGRASLERARAWRPPMAFADGAPVAVPTHADHTQTSGDTWSGHGLGARVRGSCKRIDRLDGPVPPGDVQGAIVVTRTVTPAMAFWVRDAAALVAEHGGLLGHGAAMARELGIPCVVGCRGIWSQVRSGDMLEVDGDGGRVTRHHPEP